MKKQFFSMIAAAAFLLTVGGTVVAKTTESSTKWFHVDPHTEAIISGPMEDPKCKDGAPLCSVEYNVDGLDNPLTPTGNREFGTPQ